jgi:hypothetical protein
MDIDQLIELPSPAVLIVGCGTYSSPKNDRITYVCCDQSTNVPTDPSIPFLCMDFSHVPSLKKLPSGK